MTHEAQKTFSENTSSTGFDLLFTPTPGCSYTVQASPDLSLGSWNPVPATMTGSPVTTATVLKSDLPANATRHFFRLVQTASPAP
ncbi:hypothetical protein HZ994_08180 [Akkermansiaceae bacterium]|nr:hypothetical protein HZ994_08180 [Akkermansiaceae bacterium]